MVAGVLGLIGVAWAQDPLPMPGVPTPPIEQVPLPVPAPTPLPGLPLPGPEPLPLNPSGRTAEDAPIIEFVPAPLKSEEVREFAIDYAESFVWTPWTTSADATFSSIAQRPGSESMVVLGDDEGGVWVSNDGLVSMQQTLAGIGEVTVDDSGAALDIDDVLSNVDVEAVGDYEAFQDAEAVQEAAQILEQAVDEYRETQEALGEALEELDVEAAKLFWIDDVLFVARSDGLFRSSDYGVSFQRVLAASVHAVVATELGYLAGTTDGIRYSGDGISWFDDLDGTEDVSVYAVVPLRESQAFAATDKGLYQTMDGFTWTMRTRWDDAMISLFLDPDIPGRVWVGTDRNLLSSDDSGGSFQAPLTSPLVGVTSMHWLGSLHWLAATRKGVWETLNGGLSWVPVVSGLSGEQVTGLSAVRGRVLAVAEGTIHELVRSDLPAYSPQQQAEVMQAQIRDWIPRGALIDSATQRPELTAKPSGSLLMAYLLPRVTLYGRYEITDGVQYRVGLDIEDLELVQDPGTTRPYERWWRVAVELRWSPPGRSYNSFGGADGSVAGAVVGTDLSLPGESETAGPVAVSYQADVARRVGELHTQRIQLATQRLEAERQPLMQQVFLELAIQEIEGELDVYTNGAVAEWNRSLASKSSGDSP